MFVKKILLIVLIINLSKNFSKDYLNQYKFNKYERGAGILMHITSLPSKYGIGSLGEEAYNFVDFLSKAKQKYWEILPINPTSSFGDSPFQSLSFYAGNPYMIDLDLLIKDGLLNSFDVSYDFFIPDETRVNYERLFKTRYKILKIAFKNFIKLKINNSKEYKTFVFSESYWLEDYALYMALKEKFYWKSWIEWPEDIKQRKKDTLDKYFIECKNEIDFYKFIQFEFYKQLNSLKKYCQNKGIKLIGNIPIYIPFDSIDVWTKKELFLVDVNGSPTELGGVPPNKENQQGQIWGLALNNWKEMKKDNYKWFINRLKHSSTIYDVLKINNFIEIESYWSVSSGKDIKEGSWKKGPGLDFVNEIKKEIRTSDLIAENLGQLTPEIIKFIEKTNLPEIKILQYAFNPEDHDNIYLPYKYKKNSVCYTGTHNDKVLTQFQKEIEEDQREQIEEYLGLEKNSDLRLPIIRAGLSSTSYLFITLMQDYLGLDENSRLNIPGINDGRNWRWRAKKGMLNDKLAEEISKLVTLYER